MCSPCPSCRARSCLSAEGSDLQRMNCVCRRRRIVAYLLCTLCIGSAPPSLAFQHVVPVSVMPKFGSKSSPAWSLFCRICISGIPGTLATSSFPSTPQIGRNPSMPASHSMSATDSDRSCGGEGDNGEGSWNRWLPQGSSTLLIIGDANLSFSLV